MIFLRSFVYTVALLSSAYSFALENKTTSSLLQVYANYLVNTNPENIHQRYQDYFSSALIKEAGITPETVNRTETTEQLLFKNWMTTTHSLFEKHEDGFGCLSINGKNSHNEPVTFDIEYRTENGKAKIHQLNVALHGAKDSYPKEARCPKEYLPTF